MAEDKSKKQKEETRQSESGGWLKLPKMWADAGDKADEAVAQAPTAQSSAAPATPPAPLAAGVVARKGQSARGQAESTLPATPHEGDEQDADNHPLQLDIEEMRAEMERMHRIVAELNERESSMEQVFNTLHSELMDYKKDFIYEHLKPVVRPLLFLYDSLEQFDREIELYERPTTDERRQTGLAPRLVRENIGYFREQLVEALRICEVTLMETPTGTFLPRLHKAIDVAPVDQSQDNQIIRVVRAGWYLNNQVLRPAEVVVGKAVPHPGAGYPGTGARAARTDEERDGENKGETDPDAVFVK